MSSPPLPPDIQAQMKTKDKFDQGEFVREMAAFLEDWPLYRRFVYKSGAVACRDGMKESLPFPPTLSLHCPVCQKTQAWEATSLRKGEYSGLALLFEFENTYEQISYTCRNCQKAEVLYFLFVKADKAGGELIKVGQWPPQSREPDPVVTAAWSGADLSLFRKAMTLRNSSMGIGALAYLRRVIENRMNDVLDLIDGAIARSAPEQEEEFHVQLAQLKTSRRFSDKLDFARDHLPKDLTPRGAPNPVALLYELVSEGLHAKSEEECLDLFDQCKTAFEYVVRKLSEAKREDDEYLKAVQGLTKAIQGRK